MAITATLASRRMEITNSMECDNVDLRAFRTRPG
jgi:hypothetical protein